MSAAPVISLEDVQFGYGMQRVLDIPRLWVEQGSSVLLRGISGGGKSTLLGLRFSRLRSARISGPLDAEIARLLQALQLNPELMQRRAGTLSVGQQQRVAAARALIGRPALLLADEPTSALDREAATAFLKLMSAQCQAAGTTVLVVSHDDSLQPLFDRTIALSQINQAGAGHA